MACMTKIAASMISFTAFPQSFCALSKDKFAQPCAFLTFRKQKTTIARKQKIAFRMERHLLRSRKNFGKARGRSLGRQSSYLSTGFGMVNSAKKMDGDQYRQLPHIWSSLSLSNFFSILSDHRSRSDWFSNKYGARVFTLSLIISSLIFVASS